MTDTANPPVDPPAREPLAARLSALPKEHRSGAAITDLDIAEAAALSTAGLADLCEELRAIGVRLGPFHARVKAAGRAKVVDIRSRLRLVTDDEPTDDRPLVCLGAELQENIDAAILGLSSDPDLYQRDGILVRVTYSPDDGSPVIRPHTAATLRPRLATYAHFQRYEKGKDGGEWVDCLPPDTVTKGILEQSQWTETKGQAPRARAPQLIRKLIGVLEHPSMRVDGGMIDKPGYDAATGYLYAPNAEFAKIPDAPSREDAIDSLRRAWTELSFDFPYRGLGVPTDAQRANSDGRLRYKAARLCPDAWGMVAAMGTLLVRPAIVGSIPAIVFDASMPGSGKGYQVDVVTLVVSGRIMEKLTWPNRGSGDTDQAVETMLGGEALGGATCTILDEITGPFGGPALNKVLTGDGRTKVRVLGLSYTAPCAWVSTILGIGNNITPMDNTVRRILMPRLEPPDERARDRSSFRHPKIKDWVLKNRGAIVAALLTVFRAYVLAGRPQMVATMEGFEPWADLIPQAILWAEGGDVLGCRPTLDPEARNEERDSMCAVFGALTKLGGVEGITVGRMLDALYSRDRLSGEDRSPDGYEDAREAIEALTGTKGGRKPDATALGRKLKTWRRRPIGTQRLEHIGAKDRKNVVRWGVVDSAKVAP